MNIILLGAGRVGLVSAVCYVQFGHKVLLMDVDEKKVGQIRSGQMPFLEEGLEPLLLNGLASGFLQIVSQLDESFDSDFFLICLPTPPLANGETDLSYIEGAFISIRSILKTIKKEISIVIRSTVPSLAIRSLFLDYFTSQGIYAHLLLNPEFLREGSAINDFFHPSFCVVGGDDIIAAQRVLSLYEPIQCSKYHISIESAALLKYACNAFHALKISFANEIGRLAKQMRADGGEVMRILASDTKLNASAAYLRPGFAFGGPCLIKDLASLLSFARLFPFNFPLLENILPSNEMHLQSCVDAIVNRGVNQVGIIGAAFKKGTGDLRNSPYIELARLLEAHDILVKFYDTEIPEFAHTKNLKNILDRSDLIARTSASLSSLDEEQIAASNLPVLNLEQLGFI